MLHFHDRNRHRRWRGWGAGTRRTTPKLPGRTFPGVLAVPKRRAGWLDKEFAEYEIVAMVSAAMTRGAILSTSDPFTIFTGTGYTFIRMLDRKSYRGSVAFLFRTRLSTSKRKQTFALSVFCWHVALEMHQRVPRLFVTSRCEHLRASMATGKKMREWVGISSDRLLKLVKP